MEYKLYELILQIYHNAKEWDDEELTDWARNGLKEIISEIAYPKTIRGKIPDDISDLDVTDDPQTKNTKKEGA